MSGGSNLEAKSRGFRACHGTLAGDGLRHHVTLLLSMLKAKAQF